MVQIGTQSLPSAKPQDYTDNLLEKPTGHMNDIFINYSRDDRSKVEPFTKAFKAEKWSVWVDTRIRSGTAFDREIEEALVDSRCVVVFWSQSSCESKWVRAEANEGLDRNILVSVAIEPNLKLPLIFRNIHTEDLIDWAGDKSSHSFCKIIGDLESILGPSPRHVSERRKRKTEGKPAVTGRSDIQREIVQGRATDLPKASGQIVRPYIPPRKPIERPTHQQLTPEMLKRIEEM